MTEELRCSICGKSVDFIHHEGPMPRVVICSDCLADIKKDETILKTAAKLIREAKE